jgi:hypothetical protein
MIQIDIENTFNNISQIVIFKELQGARGFLAIITPFTKLFLRCLFFFYYQHRQHENKVTIIESTSSTKQGDPLGGHLFALTHYRTFLKTIAYTPHLCLSIPSK